MVPNDLRSLAAILADWAEPADGVSLYLYGSRVRGDHRQDSDVDVLVDWPDTLSEAIVDWWTNTNTEEFQTINELLPGPIEILERDTAMASAVRRAAGLPVWRDRAVVCVWLPRKP